MRSMTQIAVILSIVAIGTAVPARAEVCKAEDVKGQGEIRHFEYRAKSSARRAWQAEVRKKFGSDWTDLSIAQGKGNYRCSRQEGFRRYQCTVEARPCKKS